MGVPTLVAAFTWTASLLTPTTSLLLPNGSIVVGALAGSGVTQQFATQSFDAQADPIGAPRSVLAADTVDFAAGVSLGPLPTDGFSVVFRNAISPHRSQWFWEAAHATSGFYFSNPVALPANADGTAPLLIPAGTANVTALYTQALAPSGPPRTALFSRSYTVASGIAGKSAPLTGALGGTITGLTAAPLTTGQTLLAWLFAPANKTNHYIQALLINAAGTRGGAITTLAALAPGTKIGAPRLLAAPNGTALLTYTTQPAGVLVARLISPGTQRGAALRLLPPNAFGITPQTVLTDGSLIAGTVRNTQALTVHAVQFAPTGAKLSDLPVGPGTVLSAAAPGGNRALYTFLDQTGTLHTNALQYPAGPTPPPPLVTATTQYTPSTETFTVFLSNPLPYDLPLSYATSNGTALSGTDYTTTHGATTIPAGATQAQIPVPLLSDAVNHPGAVLYLTVTGNLAPSTAPAVDLDITIPGMFPLQG